MMFSCPLGTRYAPLTTECTKLKHLSQFTIILAHLASQIKAVIMYFIAIINTFLQEVYNNSTHSILPPQTERGH